MVSLELILILSILVIGTFGACGMVRNSLLAVRQAKLAATVFVDDADDVRVRPVSYDLCETPQVLCQDPGFTTGSVSAGPTAGLLALVGIRATHVTSRNRIYFTDATCGAGGGTAYIAPPAVPPNSPPALPVGYFNGALQVDAGGDRVSYGVGPPSNWACTLGVDCADGGLLYRSTGGDVTPTIASRWISLNPDCSLEVLAGSGTTAVCDVLAPAEVLTLRLATPVLDAAGANVLARFTPLFQVTAPPSAELTAVEPTREGAGTDTGGGEVGPQEPTAEGPPNAGS